MNETKSQKKLRKNSKKCRRAIEAHKLLIATAHKSKVYHQEQVKLNVGDINIHLEFIEEAKRSKAYHRKCIEIEKYVSKNSFV